MSTSFRRVIKSGVATRLARDWLTFVVLYLLLAGSLALGELGAGALAAGLAAAARETLRHRTDQRFRARLRWLRLVGRTARQLLRDCIVVSGAIACAILRAESPPGRLRRVSFSPGGNDPEAAMRRTLVTSGISITPNSYVVAIDRKAERLLVHQMLAKPDPPGGRDRTWPL
jgi:multisubunit Na+/H+ antiporter MnhE subunit